MKEALLRFLQRRGPVYRLTVIEDMGLEPDHATTLLGKLRDSGLAEAPRRGLWRIVGDTRPVPAKAAPRMTHEKKTTPKVDVEWECGGVITVELSREDHSPAVDCPAFRGVTAARCLEQYVTESAQKHSKSPCHHCEVGRVRRYNYSRS